MKRETIGHNYSGGRSRGNHRDYGKKKGASRLRYILFFLVAIAGWIIYIWVTNPEYSPSFVRDILPNAPQRLYQYTNADGEIVESRVMPPGKSDAIVINRWKDVKGILPE